MPTPSECRREYETEYGEDFSRPNRESLNPLTRLAQAAWEEADFEQDEDAQAERLGSANRTI